jgi:preprotein translocase subunit SecG
LAYVSLGGGDFYEDKYMWVFFLVVHVLICVSMIGLILLQRSEGGGLVSGNPTGLVSARGRADLLTRITSILATGFFLNSIILAVLAGGYNKADKILNPLSQKVDVPLAAPEATPVVAPEDISAAQPSPLREEKAAAAPHPHEGLTPPAVTRLGHEESGKKHKHSKKH